MDEYYGDGPAIRCEKVALSFSPLLLLCVPSRRLLLLLSCERIRCRYFLHLPHRAAETCQSQFP